MRNLAIGFILSLFFLCAKTQLIIHSYEVCDDIDPRFKYCNLRDEIFPEPIFKWNAGYWCYHYSPPTRFKNGTENRGYIQNVPYLDNITYSLIYSRPIDNPKVVFYYDYTDENYVKYVRDSFASEIYFQNWLECAKNADKCCNSQMINQICPNEEYPCPAVWDAWDCFSPTTSGITVTHDCPKFVYTGDPPCIQSSEKECFQNGTWNKTTNYANCQFLELVKSRHLFHVAVLAISAIFCVPAIIIFFIYPPLRVTRVILHRNLVIAIFIKNIFVIMSKVILTIYSLSDSSIINENGVPCRMLAFFERFFINAMYACMLVDGFYLHKSIVRLFSKDPSIWILYGVIAVLSFVPIFTWAIFKTTQDDTYCWIVDDSWRQWLIDGSRYAMLGINTIFLIDILRVFLWKLKENSANNNNHAKTTLRATLILLPLFGIQFAMMSQRPVNISCIWDSVFYYFSYTMDSLQGIMVSLLYCYMNKEVQSLLIRSYNKFKFTRERRQTLNFRKNTAATYVPGNNNTEKKEEMAKIDELVEIEDNGTAKVENWFCQNETK